MLGALNNILKEIVNIMGRPEIFFTGSMVGWWAMMKYYRTWTQPKYMKWAFWASIVFLGWSLTDYNFFIQATKPDNVPIWLMSYGVGYFTWLSFRRAALNDERIEAGQPTLEKEESDKKVYTWPDLVYPELISMVAFTAFLTIWAIVLKAPLEEPANTGVTPNPAKAPWYFLGLQEMLVYFDPWLAGVLLPGLIIVGLVGLPFFDINPKGNGYYTVKERFWAIWGFGYGFLILWIALIFLGTFLRGPSWNFFGPFEYWDNHKVLMLSNINLSEYIWVKILNVGLPSNILIRESVGILLCVVYLLALPPLLAVTIFKDLYPKMGFVRYNLFCHLLIMMAAMPIKMYLRWTLNLKYLVAIPEYLFNI